jgi:hypothetical protein
MSKPLALELADALTSMPIGVSISKIEAAGEELRRLHAANAELVEELSDLLDEGEFADYPGTRQANAVKAARAALSKHKE